jgi:hypothetical protein
MKFGIWLLLFAQAAGEVAITGRVTDALTHQPIAEATVGLCCPRVDTTADSNGTYKLPAKAGGPEQPLIVVAKTGYATIREPLSEKRNFELSPCAQIAGRLTDRDTGKPIPGFTVTAWRLTEERPEEYQGRSGEDGGFVIAADLAPGRYVLEIDPPAHGRVVAGKPRPDEEGYGRTWFPGVPRRDMAAPVAVASGESRFIELRMQKRELRHVAGTIEVPQGREKVTFSFSLSDGPGPLIASGVGFRPGPLRIEGLDEGAYAVYATTGSGLSLSQAIDLGTHSIDDLKLTLRDEMSIRASVTVQEDGVAAPRGLLFFPFPAVMSDFVTEPSDKLVVGGLPVGRYWPELITPPGFAVIAASYGGRSVLNRPVDFEAPESTVDFVITSRAASVGGIVRDSNQKPVAGVLVALTPDAAPGELSMVAKHQLSTKSDANGVFRIAGLAPGKYHVSGFGDAIELDFGQNATLELHTK